MEAVLWMALVLKIPIFALLWLVWWAAKAPEPADATEDDGGSKQPDRPHGPLSPPRPPRRGPDHGAPLPAPPRVRTRAVGRRSGVGR
ncbi:MAG TPA: hypothetical protein VHF88_06415 [Thermoleophilaceae bacterium]|nr:hypothetical protein [Thermoleophilaceae bacterium]